MELRQLETFRVVMNTLSMSAAAKQLYLSPSAVSLQIRHLGEELGTELFIPSGGRLVPTSDARRLQRDLDPIIGALHAIREDFPSKIERDARPFVLATGSTTLIYQLPGPLDELRDKYPRNDIRVWSATTQSILSSLEHKQVDLGIVSLPVEAPNIQLEPLFREEMLALVQASSAHQNGKTIGLKDLIAMPMILYSIGTTERTIIDRIAHTHGISWRVVMEVDCTESIKKFVEAGFGASILPKNALRDTPRLRKFEIEEVHPFRELALATARTAHPRKLTTEIAAYLREKLGNQPWSNVCKSPGKIRLAGHPS